MNTAMPKILPKKETGGGKTAAQSEMKYRLLFYNNPLPMWMVTIPDLMIIDVNDAVIKQYGYSREEFSSSRIRDLRPEEICQTSSAK